MQLSDITVEVRDIDLTRLGVIRPEDLDLEAQDYFNNVGTWKLQLAYHHPLARDLRQPGSGIIVTGPNDVLFSGPMVKSQTEVTPDSPNGIVSLEGVTDSVALADALAFPEPSNLDPMTQTVAHDIRTGAPETIMHGYVNANIGPSAPSSRRKAKLIMGTDGARGTSTTKSARFAVLGNLLGEIAIVAGLGFRIVQRGDNLVFETYAVADRSAEVRLDVRNNTLAGQRVAITPPGITRAIVAGQGELTARQFLSVETTDSLVAEAEWGRRIEKFIDQRQTNDEAELQQAGDEAMAEAGMTGVAVQAIPVENTSMRYAFDWGMGDKVGVVVDEQELASINTGFSLKANSEGFRLGAILGDPVGFDRASALSARLRNLEALVAKLAAQ